MEFALFEWQNNEIVDSTVVYLFCVVVFARVVDFAPMLFPDFPVLLGQLSTMSPPPYLPPSPTSARADALRSGRHTLKMLEIASLFLRPESSLWLLRMRIKSQHQFTAGGVERSARGVFGDMLRIACSAFPSYR